MDKYTVLTNLKVTDELVLGAVQDNNAIVAVNKAASTPTKAEFDALVDVVNALTAALGRQSS